MGGILSTWALGEAAQWQNWPAIAYSFWHSPAGGVAVIDYEAALSVFLWELGKAAIPGLTRFLTVRFEQLAWVSGRPAYQDWYELEDSASLDTLEAGAVRADMEAPHAAIARLAGDGTGGLFAAAVGEERS